MSILIIGGLLGLAVVAILGAVLLGISEDRAEKAQKAGIAASAPAPTALLPQQSQSRHLSAPEGTPALPATPVLARPTVPLPPFTERESFAGLNGQVREITDELRTLALRAGELEQHLNLLSDRLERQQMRQSGVSSPLYSPEVESNTDA